MQLPPPSVLATYPKPNYVNPETKGPSLLIWNAVLFALGSIVIVIRIYARVHLSNNFGLDDAFILLAMLLAAALFGTSIYAYATSGGTRHLWDIPIQDIAWNIKLALITQLLFATAVSLVKISMLLLTRRIMAKHSRTMQHLIIFSIAFVALGNVSFTLVTIFQCTPVSAQWTLSFEPQNCINTRLHLLIASIINVLSDFIVVLIPIPIVLKLKMAWAQRIIVVLLFSTGFAACIAGIVRTVILRRMEKPRADFTWDMQPVFIAGAVELYAGIICASIPPSKAFFTRYIPKLLSTGGSESTGQGKSNNSSLGRRLFKSDEEKAIPLSDLSDNNHQSKPRRPSRLDSKIESTTTLSITHGNPAPSPTSTVHTAGSELDHPARVVVWGSEARHVERGKGADVSSQRVVTDSVEDLIRK